MLVSMHKNNRYDLIDNGQGCKIVGSELGIPIFNCATFMKYKQDLHVLHNFRIIKTNVTYSKI